MATETLQYLDPDGLDETVLNIGQIKTNLEGQISNLGESIEEELQNLPYARPDGLYPDMTVGAVIGADSTAQWSTRESTGSVAATVRSVQGAAVVWNQINSNPTFTSTDGYARSRCNVSVADNIMTAVATSTTDSTFHVQAVIPDMTGHVLFASVEVCAVDEGFENIRLIDARGAAQQPASSRVDNPTAGEWTRLYGNFSLASTWMRVLSDNLEAYAGWSTKIRNFFIVDLTTMYGAGNEPTAEQFINDYRDIVYPYSAPTLKPVTIAGIASTDAQGGELDAIEWPTQTLRAAGSVADELTSGELVTRVGERNYQSGDESDATVRTDGTTTYYPLATPTTTPISPALPMTYRVQAGGSESIIVPAGEVSAAPVLTIAESVNAGDEFARIWAAIESLGYTRNTTQLSRPVSLTDIGSIDEVQKDTTDVVEKEAADVAEIDTVKEVQE